MTTDRDPATHCEEECYCQLPSCRICNDPDYQEERRALADELDLPLHDPKLDEYIRREQEEMF